MTITVINYIAQYLRPSLASVADYSDVTLGYWIDAALLDISRSFPRKLYALWTCTTAQFYPYSDSTTTAKDTNIIRVLNCLYPFSTTTLIGTVMGRKNHLDSDFLEGDYYEPDNENQVIYLGKTVTAGLKIYADCHCYWTTVTGVIVNPSEHYELIRLFCIWQAYLHQVADIANSSVPDSAYLNAVAAQSERAEQSYHTLYDRLDQSKATSGITQGWAMDKWDVNAGQEVTLPGDVPPGHKLGTGPR